MLGTVPFTVASLDVLIVVPLFMLMGEFTLHAGIGEEAYSAVRKMIGHVRGGLGMATIIACGCFAAVCGSSMATAATISGTAYPEMKKYSYNPKLSTGVLAAGGTLGILIPPSGIMVLYAWLTEQSIPAMFIVPVSSRARPVSRLMVVVLPAPLGPRNPNSSPLLTWKLIPFTATTSP